MTLTKVVICKDKNIDFISIQIKDYIKKNPTFSGQIIVDKFNKVHTKDTLYIPQLFNNNTVYISYKSFQQNHSVLAKMIRKYTYSIIKNFNNIICIGGESYIYALTSKINNIYHYTNNIHIYNDVNYNLKYYHKNLVNIIVNYNNNIDFPSYSNCLINLSKLNIKLIQTINNNNFNNIIIISCHHNDFWKKIKLLSNYKLQSRKKFICYKMKYFITVNILIKKNTYISLGHNCSVAWNLQQLNLRTISYPFDWCEMSLKQLIKVLSNNFLDYEKLEIVKLSTNHINFDNNKPSYIIKNPYNIKFAHEVISKMELNEFSNKLLERITRFKNLKNPIFIRIENNNINNYDELKLLLNKYFDKYKLIIIDKNNYTDWKYSHLDWKKILLKWNIIT